ncbi:winged helix-turn-helix transcriptional regulator [Novosphingobium terrae]|uniref:winged helix-turn-helix transcriptional regulator n=1 Tax=Novosphingobium terrae TaxID=2726189 RepID=UPI00197FC470|nr:helix-turn-helix domain-containing protein [Novosphingobium terrae]
MDNEKFSQGPCPVGRALTLVGDAWSMMILRDAGLGITRFDQFRASLGIAPNILTRRLAALVDHGLLEKRRYCEQPPRDEYVLTPKGRDFLPVLLAIGAWGRQHCEAPATSTTIDADTQKPVDPVVIDRLSGRLLAEMNLKQVPPSG